MNLPTSFNPSEGMDYASWLTISGFIMAILIFYMHVVLRKLSGIYEFFYTILGVVVSILIFVLMGSILFFIFNITQVGATLVTLVLIVLLLLSPTLLAYQLAFENSSQIDKLLPVYQPGVDLD